MEKFRERCREIADFLKIHIDWIGIGIGLLFVFWLVYDLWRTRLIEISTAGIILGIGAVAAALAYFFFRFYGFDKKGKILSWLLIALMTAGSVFGIGISDQLTAAVQKLSWHDKNYKEYIGFYAYRQAPVGNLDADSSEVTIGILTTNNGNLNNYALDQLRERGVKFKTHNFGSIQQMIRALKGQSVQLLLLEPYQIELAKEYPELARADKELVKVESVEVDTNMNDEPSSVDVETDPYSVLIMTSTDPLNKSSFRTYQCLLAWINPQTQQILLINLPRNLLIPESCSNEAACTPGAADKISLLTFHSQNVLRQSLEAWLGSEINYTVRIDMKTLDNILEKTGTVRVNNPNYYISGNTVFNQGEIDLNAVTADIYLSDFNDFSEADQQTENNHLNVLRGFLPFNWITSLFDMEPVLDIVKNSIETDFSYDSLCEIVRTFILYPNHWDVHEMSPVVRQGFENSSILSGYTYVNGILDPSLDRIRGAIEALKNGDEINTDQSDIQEALNQELEAQAQAQAETQAAAEAAAQAAAEEAAAGQDGQDEQNPQQ